MRKAVYAGSFAFKDDITVHEYEKILIKSVSEVDSNWPRWIIGKYLGNGQYADENRKSNGDNFNKWFMAGKTTLGSGGTGSKPPSGYTGGGTSGEGSNPNKKPTSPNKGNAGNGSTSTGNNNNNASTGTGTSTRQEKDAQIRNSMRAEYDKWIAAGKSTTYAADKAVVEGNRLLQQLRNTFAYDEEDLVHWADVIRTYGAKLHAPDGAMGSMSINPFTPAYKEFADGSFLFDIGYAAEDDGSHLTDKGKAYDVMNGKDGDVFWFKFTNGVTMSKTTDPKTGELVDSVVATICDNDYRILVEPLIWFTPEKYDGGRCDAFSEAFYGTVTNYGQFIDYVTSRGAWSDGNEKYKGKYTQKDRTGIGGNYNYVCNFFGAYSLHLNEDLVFSSNPSKNIGAVQGKTNATSSNCVRSIALGSNTDGYALFYYYGDPGGWVPPRTQTYDPFEKDPNPTPHKAPNPDPNYKTPSGKTPVPLAEGENPEPRTNDWTGYQQVTRTVNIVKCYDIEHIDGSIEHVKTEGRRWNPGTIDVMQEPDYKVVGYYTSPYYIGYDIFQDLTEIWTQWRIPTQMVFITAMQSPDWDDDEGKSAWINTNYETTWEGMRERCLEISPEYGMTAKYNFDDKIEFDEKAEAGKVVGTVQIGVVADLDFTKEKEEAGELPKEGYDDTTLYVHLIKKEKIPETSTYDEPDHTPSGTPPAVPPHPSQDPHEPEGPNFDPETTPVEENDPYCHYRIVKVYETITVTDEGEQPPESDGVYVTYKTNPIVYIEDEAQSSDPFDGSWHLIDWCVSDTYNNVPPPDLWKPITDPLPKKQSGSGESKVDLIDKDDKEKEVTLYVHLVRKIKEGNPTGAIIIQQSQISKTIHTNDSHIGGYFGNYTFQFYEGGFKTGHITHFDHCCVPGDCRYHTCKCLGHWCAHQMPGADGDDHLDFAFDLMSGQDELEIKKGIHSDLDPKVYGKGGSAFGALKDGNYLHYPKTLTSLAREDFTFPGDGNDGEGAEYVTILWRGTPKYNDVPTLAQYKKNDITQVYGADNYTIPEKLLNSAGSQANRKSNKKRASQYWVGMLEFTFGLEEHGNRSDRLGISSCVDSGGKECIDYDPKYVGTYDQFTYDFEAGVAIRFYAGKQIGLQAAPFGGPSTTPILEKQIGNHAKSC